MKYKHLLSLLILISVNIILCNNNSNIKKIDFNLKNENREIKLFNVQEDLNYYKQDAYLYNDEFNSNREPEEFYVMGTVYTHHSIPAAVCKIMCYGRYSPYFTTTNSDGEYSFYLPYAGTF